MMYYVRLPNGARYKVRQAISLDEALSAIAHARVTGSVGSKSTRTEVILGAPMNEWPETVIADVHRVNSDNTEQEPYHDIY